MNVLCVVGIYFIRSTIEREEYHVQTRNRSNIECRQNLKEVRGFLSTSQGRRSAITSE